MCNNGSSLQCHWGPSLGLVLVLLANFLVLGVFSLGLDHVDKTWSYSET